MAEFVEALPKAPQPTQRKRLDFAWFYIPPNQVLRIFALSPKRLVGCAPVFDLS
jgi:hypothetical protein